MQFDLRSILSAMRATVVNPRQGARRVLDLNLPAQVGAMALALMVIISALLSLFAAQVFASGGDDGLSAMLRNPLQVVAVQAVVLAITLMLMVGVGRRFGGQGNMTQALSLLAWLEAILNLLQAAQLLLLFVSPSIAEGLGFISILLFLWLLANFIAEMHGFASAGKVLLMILLTGFAVSFVIAFLGIMLFGMGAANV